MRTTRRRNKDGSVVEYYQLAHNFRHPETNVSTVEVVHSFGRADELDRDDLVRLCRSIARVAGLQIRDPLEEEGEIPAVADGGLPHGVRLLETKELGTVWAIEALWERLGVGPTLRAVAKHDQVKVPYERALLAMTANRLCEPESKLGVWGRWLDSVHLPSCAGLKLPQMYEAMDLLHRHSAEVEEKVFFHTADLFNLTVDLVFYDTTTISFSIDYEDEDSEEKGLGLRKYGESKEGTWTAQVVVALAVTRQGLPVRSWVFPGNTTDVKTVERVRKDLRGWKLGRALFVADAGMNSLENREELARACGKYVLATRLSSVSEIREQVLGRAGRYQELAGNLKVKEVTVGDGERRRRYFLCLNPEEQERQERHRAEVLEEIETELAAHPSKDPTQKWAIELMASKRTGRYLTIRETKKGKRIAIDRAVVKAAERCDGKWVIITNDDTLETPDAAHAYRGLLVIERCFRSLKKTQIKMGPMYHWLPRRIEAHVKICVLALLIQRVAENSCGKPWAHIRRTLRRMKATEFATNSHHFFQRNELPAAVQKTLQVLEIKPPKPVLDVQ